MHIRSTIDPISFREVPEPAEHPCVYDGDGENGIEVYFENEENRQAYLDMELQGTKILRGDDTEDYVAEG